MRQLYNFIKIAFREEHLRAFDVSPINFSA